MNATTPPDALQRQAALNVMQSFIVQAPAGSGKTELLTQRVLALLATVKQPEEIVAITFTRKAAAEMRMRILKALQNAELPEPTQEHEKNTWILAKNVLLQSKKFDWHLLENPNRLRVTTIDALCLSLVGQMPVLSRMGIQPKVTENPDKIYLSAIQKIFQHIDSRPTEYAISLKKVFRYFHYDIEFMTKLFQKMLQYREQWLSYAIHGQTEEFQARLQESLYYIIHDALQNIFELAESHPYFSQILPLLTYASSNLSQSDHGQIIDAWPDTAPEYLVLWQRIADICLTNDNNWRKKLTVNEGFPPESYFKNVSEKATAKQFKAQFMQFLAELANEPSNDALRLALENIRNLPSAEHYDEQWEIISALLNVLTLLAGELRLEFQTAGKTDFTEIACAAKEALGHHETPTDLLLSLDNQIQHLLVDEFQDTSKLQFELIEKLTSGWHDNDGRTLFLVGDPMQSIYRFRQAEVGLFIKACQEGIGELSLIPLKLTANFRSDEKIVHWINNSFKDAFPLNDDIPSGAISYSPSNAMRYYSNDTGIHFYPHYDEEGFQLKLLEQLHLLLNDEKQKSIAILVRSRKNAKQILPWLRAAKIPYQAIDIESLELQPLIYDLLALLKALIYLGDRTAWFAILRAPWCGLLLADLLIIAKHSPKGCLWECINNFAMLTELSLDAKKRLTRIVPILAFAIEQRFRLPLRQWIEHTWIALGGPACIPNRSTLNDAFSFFDVLANIAQSDGQFDITEFEQQLKYTFATAPITDNVRIHIMTMHKSKGLEFDTVILPALHEAPRNDDNDILVWMDQPRSQQHENDILLAMCQPAGVESDKLYKYIRAQEQQKTLFENTRILYVAATRAKQQLCLYFQVGQGHDNLLVSKRSFLALLWPTIENAVIPHLPNIIINDNLLKQPESDYYHNHSTTTQVHRLSDSWQLPELINFSNAISTRNEGVTFDWHPDLERRVGIVLHRLFKTIGKQGLSSWQQLTINQQMELIRRFCFLAGLNQSQFFKIQPHISMCLEKMFNSQRGQWMLSMFQISPVEFEYALETIQQHELKQFVLDTTFIDETNTRWIVDYKTAYNTQENLTLFLQEQKQMYMPQLERYAQLMKKISPHPIKLALYFPLLDEWIEWNATIN